MAKYTVSFTATGSFEIDTADYDEGDMLDNGVEPSDAVAVKEFFIENNYFDEEVQDNLEHVEIKLTPLK